MGSGEKVGVASITGGMSDEEGASLPSDSKMYIIIIVQHYNAI